MIRSGTASGRIAVLVVLLCAGALAIHEYSRKPLNPGAGKARPNVLIILWDTVRADRLSAYGYERNTTPYLKAFAEEAALFERAVSPAIWTVPSHASLFTGLPVSAHGATAYHKWIDQDLIRISQRFNRTGYDTYLFSSNPFVSETTNATPGFDTVHRVWDPPWSLKTVRHTQSKLTPRDRSNRLAELLEGAGPDANPEHLGLVPGDLTQSGPVINEAFLQWLTERDSSKPFFAFLNYMEAHYPRIPSRSARERVMSADDVSRSYSLDQDHPLIMDFMFGKHEFSADELAVMSGVYDASLVDLDSVTHELLASLKERNLLDQTVVVITSDHGENLGDHGLMGHNFAVYNTLSRVPLVVRYPPRMKARRVSFPVSVLDVPLTLLELAGIPVEGAHPYAVSLLDGDKAEAPRPMVTEMLAPMTNALAQASKRHPDLNWNPWMRWYRGIELGKMKFIWSSDGRHELYDLDADPDEARNLFPNQPGRSAPLVEALTKWLGSFEHYDTDEARQEGAKPLTPQELSRLRALGYVQ